MRILTPSVPLGWQTEINGKLVGPVFDRVHDLWKWQGENLDPVTGLWSLRGSLRTANPEPQRKHK